MNNDPQPEENQSPTHYRDKVRAYSHCMERCPSEVIARAALEQADSLAGERKHRGTGLHPDDSRIVNEISSTQIDVARRRRQLLDESDRCMRRVEQIRKDIQLLDEAHAALRGELDIFYFGLGPTPS